MGIRFYCPNGHKLNVKEFQGGKTGICPFCGTRIEIPTRSTRKSSKHAEATNGPAHDATAQGPAAVLSSPPAPAGPAVSQPLPEASAWPSAPASAATPMPQPSMPGPAPGEPPMYGQPPTYGHPQTYGQPAAYGAGTLPPSGPVPMSSAPPPPSAGQTPPDPLVEAGDVVWYVRPASGGQFGPAGPDVMRSWIEEGRVSADSLVWHEGWRDWQEASEVFPQLGPQGNDLGVEPIGTGVGSRASTLRNTRAVARRRSNTTRTLVIVGLILAVIILLGVFALIVSGSSANADESVGPAPVSPSQWTSAQRLFRPVAQPTHPWTH